MHQPRLLPPLTVLVLALPLVGPALPAAAAAAPTAAVTTRAPQAPRVTTLAVPALPQAQRRAVVVAPDDAAPGATASQSMTQQAVLTERATKDFGLVGVTWAKGTGQEPVRVQVRTRSNGTWSSWTDLDADTDTDGAGSRGGTEPLWAGDADGVAARVLGASGQAPKNVDLVLVDPGPAPAAAKQAQPAQSAPAATSSPAYTPKPSIISRAAWGARANSTCDDPRYGSTELGVVFHHTAGSNSYTAAQSAGIVRSIQSYHMSGRGWCDIGYNFLVDKYGQIFEGRSGGELYQVRGAHAGNSTVNTYTTGVSMLGNLDTAQPSAAMRAAATRLIGWRIGTFYLPATGSYSIAGKTLPRIAGHRDVYNAGIRPATSTACPGRYGYAFLTGAGGLRDSVATYTSNYHTAISVTADRLGRGYTGSVFVGEYPLSGGWKTRFANGDIVYKPGYGPHWMPKGPFIDEYARVGSAAGGLGFPVADVQSVGSQAFQRFQKGSIYRTSASTALALVGDVEAKYRSLGGLASRLGYPTSRVGATSTTFYATFSQGRIDFDRASGKFTVTYR